MKDDDSTVDMFAVECDEDMTSDRYRVLLAAYQRLLRQLASKQRRIETLEALATTDPLTGLLNRRGFERELRRWADFCRRSKMPMSLLFVDVAQFKAFNDSHGHTEGDRALRQIGQALTSTSGSHAARDTRLAEVMSGTIRFSDPVPARMGGDEYVLIAPAADEAGARALEKRVRNAVGALTLPSNWVFHLHVEAQTCRGDDLDPKVVWDRLYEPPANRIAQHKRASR